MRTSSLKAGKRVGTMSGRDSTVLDEPNPANDILDSIDVQQLTATYGKAVYIKVFLYKLRRHEWFYLDLGSQVTLIPSWMLQNDNIQLLPSALKAQSASGHILKSLGKFYTKLRLESSRTIQLTNSPIEVVENLNGRPILGTGLLFRNHSDLTVSIDHQCIMLDNQTAGVDIISSNPPDLSPPQTLRLSVKDDVIVPPRSEQQIATQITQKVPRPATFLINRSFTNTEPQLCIGSSLYHITTDGNEFPILLLNPNDVALTVKLILLSYTLKK